MNSMLLRVALLESGMPNVLIGGSDYAVPTLAWLQGPFYSAFQKELFDQNLQTWLVRWECRDFARAYASDASKANALSGNSPAGTDALAVGEFWFTPDASRYGSQPGQMTGTYAGEGHAINILVTDQGLQWLDPQNNLPWLPSKAEIASATLVKF